MNDDHEIGKSVKRSDLQSISIGPDGSYTPHPIGPAFVYLVRPSGYVRSVRLIVAHDPTDGEAWMAWEFITGRFLASRKTRAGALRAGLDRMAKHGEERYIQAAAESTARFGKTNSR